MINLDDIDCVPNGRQQPDGIGDRDELYNILLFGHDPLWWVFHMMFVFEPVYDFKPVCTGTGKYVQCPPIQSDSGQTIKAGDPTQ